MTIETMLENCRICPRQCGVNRTIGQRGYCGADDQIRIARAAAHMWEEPCISGTKGSGAVFFCGCSLGCVYCQNREISQGAGGRIVTVRGLSRIFLHLQEEGLHNINLVTASHYTPQVVQALRLAKAEGLTIPVVWNSSGYERVEMLQLLEGLVDIWLPDFKYDDAQLARELSKAGDYPAVARAALQEMVRQMEAAGGTAFSEDGLMRRGVIVRHLLLPGHVKQSERVVSYLLDTYGSRIRISLMSQYTPMPAVAGDPLLSRRVTKREYERLVRFATDHGLEEGFIQEREVAKESFIPAFDGTGVLTGKDIV